MRIEGGKMSGMAALMQPKACEARGRGRGVSGDKTRGKEGVGQEDEDGGREDVGHGRLDAAEGLEGGGAEKC
jgi:hypothetical protein